MAELEPLEDDPFETFKGTLKSIYLIKRRAATAIQIFERERAELATEVDDLYAKRLEVEEAIQLFEEERAELATETTDILAQLYEAQTDGSLQEAQNYLKRKMQERDEDLTTLQKELDTWVNQSTRRTAIAYCIAFESFLRDFLIWQLQLSPEMLEQYAVKKLELPLVIRDKPLPIEMIENRVDFEAKSFQDLIGGKAYNAFLGVNGALIEFRKTPSFEDKAKWLSALKDIRLLIEIRHKIVHRNGKSDNKYHQRLRELACRPRLNQIYFESWAENFEQGKFPEPDEILGSPACDLPGKDKLDEISDSLNYYAGYVVEICQRVSH